MAPRSGCHASSRRLESSHQIVSASSGPDGAMRSLKPGSNRMLSAVLAVTTNCSKALHSLHVNLVIFQLRTKSSFGLEQRRVFPGTTRSRSSVQNGNWLRASKSSVTNGVTMTSLLSALQRFLALENQLLDLTIRSILNRRLATFTCSSPDGITRLVDQTLSADGNGNSRFSCQRRHASFIRSRQMTRSESRRIGTHDLPTDVRTGNGLNSARRTLRPSRDANSCDRLTVGVTAASVIV